MDYIRFAISNPVKVTVGVLLTILFGVIALVTIPVQLTPNVDPTIITVNTEWVGKSPDEVEREIVEEQEDVLKNVTNLKKMTATARRGGAEIELEFHVGTELQAARVEVSDSLREVPEYPDDADEPVITTGEAGAGSPIAWLLLTSEDKIFDVQALGDMADERIKPFLERVPGVSEVRVYGGREREVHVEFDPHEIAQRGIMINDLRGALRRQNVNVSAGDLSEGRYETRVRMLGEYDDLDKIRETVIAYDPTGGPVRVRDVAAVSLGYEKRRTFVRSRGELALALPVYRESGSNVMAVMDQLKKRIAEINDSDHGVLKVVAHRLQQELGLPKAPKLKLTHVYDETNYIDDALALVRNNLFIGGSLAGLVLLLFLRILRPTLIIGLTIPISVIGTFVVMTAFGRNINVISLAGLAFAVGMVVDNAIVVLENIDRHIGMGQTPKQAAYTATREVWGAILASTLTTLAVFVPVLTIEEEAGQLFRDIALAICAAVTLSLIVSITVIPSASARWLRKRGENRSVVAKAGRSLFGLVNVIGWFADRFAALIHWSIAPNVRGVLVRVLVVGAFTIVSIVGALMLMPPTDYLPRGNKNLVFGIVLTPPGFSIAMNEDIAERVEAQIRPYWEAKGYDELAAAPPVIHPFTGQPIQNIPPLANYFFVTFQGNVFNGATSRDKENVQPVGGLLSAATTDVEVVGAELDQVRMSATALRDGLFGLYGPQAIQPSPLNFDKAGREMQFEINRVRAADLDLDVQALGNAIAAMVDGVIVGEYRLAGEMIDVVVRQAKDGGYLPEQLSQTPLAYRTRDNKVGTVPLSSVARVTPGEAPQEIRRIEEQRAVTLLVTPPDEVPLEVADQTIRELEKQLREQGRIPPTVQINLAGSADKLSQVREALLGKTHSTFGATFASLFMSRMFLALLVTYLLMAALFESFTYPFVIMFAVPLATVGGGSWDWLSFTPSSPRSSSMC